MISMAKAASRWARANSPPRRYQAGFTLIELSIVLVIIGLIVGGVLVGRDLISASEVRAGITQIEKYQQAANTFRTKYGYLPGDIPAASVRQFGFTVIPTRTGDAGRGNGDGIMHAYIYPTSGPIAWGLAGEILFFWADLSGNSRLIDGSYCNGCIDGGINLTSNAAFAPYIPASKIGSTNYVTVYSVNYMNYFQIVNPSYTGNNSELDATPGLTVKQAYSIDKKTDDGFPTTGNVTAAMSISYTDHATTANTIISSSYSEGGYTPVSVFSAASASGTTCYDTTSGQYSVNQNNGQGANCPLSFKFQ